VEQLVCTLLQVYLYLLFGRIVLSWFPISGDSPMATIYGFLYSITEPVLGPVRRVMPPIGAGGMGIDLSPLIVVVAVGIIQSRVC
jgi:YggT family protein